ncbi:serine hydrolase domain-containing protein [Dyella flagellata]|uniref:Serine hydrolase n=1 Tax=Dyella flagellata TaxID=1867833 RepID=A0ABQ5XEW6_9GAMM|nr:serine hydrolase domain-containing protein [Dyella flagellata]GLQ90224.1 serine hydrolase [Dyella flagellata]
MRNTTWIGCALMLACTATQSSTTAHSVRSDNPIHSALDRAVDQAAQGYFRNSCHVGLSVVVREGGSSYFYNYGSTSRSKPQLPTEHSIYELASVTKTFTATLAAQAVSEKRLDLDSDFQAYLPDRYTNLTWQGKPITLLTLLTHRSGMPRDIPDTDAIFAENNPATRPSHMLALFQGFGRDQFLSALHDVKLRSEPSTKEAYSNAGFLVIGLGLEQVYGKPFETLVRERITQPLGMTSTGFAVTAVDRAKLVSGYDRVGRSMPYHPQNAGAAWGLYASPQDMANYLRLQLDTRDPAIRVSHQPLVGAAGDGEAMAWYLGQDNGQPMIWHGGGSFGMSSQMVLYPRQHQGFVLLANDTCEGTESALKGIAQSIHRQIDSIAPSP